MIFLLYDYLNDHTFLTLILWACSINFISLIYISVTDLAFHKVFIKTRKSYLQPVSICHFHLQDLPRDTTEFRLQVMYPWRRHHDAWVYFFVSCNLLIRLKTWYITKLCIKVNVLATMWGYIFLFFFSYDYYYFFFLLKASSSLVPGFSQEEKVSKIYVSVSIKHY